MPKDIVAYSTTFIKNCRSRLEAITSEIKEHKQTLIQAQGEIQNLERSISKATTEYHRTHYLVLSLEQKQRNFNLSETLGTLSQAERGGKVKDQIAKDLSQQRQASHALLVRYNQAVDQSEVCQNTVNDLQKKIQTLQKEADELTIKIKDAENYLIKMKTTPQEAFHELHQRLLGELTKYDLRYPSAQPLAIRQTLFELRAQAALIKEHESKDENDNPKKEQLKYAQLCGLLWSTWASLDNELNEKLKNQLLDVLLETHIEQGGSLPEGLSDHSCVTLYRLRGNFIPLDRQAFEEEEKNIYQKALKDFNLFLTKNPSLEPAGRCLLSSINTEKIATSQPDYKFYTLILDQSQALSKKPQHPTMQAQYKALAEHAHGTPSIKRAMLGLLLMVAGVALLAASIFGLLYSCGALTPISAIGMSHAKLMILTGVSVLGFMGSFSGFEGGCTLFGSGLRQGLSKRIMDFEHCVENLPRPNSVAGVTL